MVFLSILSHKFFNNISVKMFVKLNFYAQYQQSGENHLKLTVPIDC